MLNLHFKAIFQAKACILRRKGLNFAHFFILIYAYNLLNINIKNKACKLSMFQYA